MTQQSDTAAEPPADREPKKERRDRTHWLYILVIVGVVAGVVVGLVAGELVGVDLDAEARAGLHTQHALARPRAWAHRAGSAAPAGPIAAPCWMLLTLIENDQCCSSKVTTLACSG